MYSWHLVSMWLSAFYLAMLTFVDIRLLPSSWLLTTSVLENLMWFRSIYRHRCCKSKRSLSGHVLYLLLMLLLRRVPKLVTPITWNASYSVCSSWILTSYPTLHCHNITYRYGYYDIHTLPCVLSVAFLWHQSLFTLGLHSLHCYYQKICQVLTILQ